MKTSSFSKRKSAHGFGNMELARLDILNDSEIAMEMAQIDLFSQQFFFAANLGVCNKTSRKAHEQSSFFQIMQLVSCSPMLHDLEETALLMSFP